MTHSGRSVAALLLIVGAMAGGCQPEPRPRPTPDPGPVYQPIPPEWCAQLRLDEIFARFDMAAADDPTGPYHVRDDYWGAHCSINADGVTDRFATLNEKFYLSGVADFTLYRDPAKAREQQRFVALEYEDDDDDVMIVPVDGWWDVGHSNEFTEDSPRNRPDRERILTVFVSYTVYDGNFLVQMQLLGEVYEPDVPELTDVLHGLARAVLAETASHLELTGRPTPER